MPSIQLSLKPLFAVDAFRDFSRVTDREVYRRLPDGWLIGVTDVVNSTEAIEAGRYKAVNMAGASIISAVMNGLAHVDFPFSFGGDGAQFAAPGVFEGVLRDVMARTARWTAEELGLELRAALVPLDDIRTAGHDVLVAQYAPSPAVTYAMFAGGGMEWAEDALKAARYAVDPAPPGQHADLTGLSCRWKPMQTRAGVILSLIVRPAPGAVRADFFAALGRVIEFIETETGAASPVPAEGPDFGSPLAGLDLEARAEGRRHGPGFLKLLFWRVFAWVIVTTGISVGGFDPAHYRRQTVVNSDFRKFHDGLDMTLDCTEAVADAIESLLARLERDGVLNYGVHRQSAALMTCIVPSYATDNHMHFIDGAEGGYTAASRRIKALASPAANG